MNSVKYETSKNNSYIKRGKKREMLHLHGERKL